jgi:iron complex outermembrane receptor protein
MSSLETPSSRAIGTRTRFHKWSCFGGALPCSILSLLLTGSAATLSFGQAAPPPPTGTAAPATPRNATSSDQAPKVIESVTVTSRKRDEIDQETPISMTVLNEKTLDTHSVQSFREIQYLTPGLRLEGSNNNSFGLLLNIRGQESSQQLIGIDPSVGIYVDGVYQTSTIGLNLQDTYGIERMEVLKGPQGTLYGRNTPGGAISIITKDPSDTFDAAIRLDLGSYGQHLISGYVNVPIVPSRAEFRLDGQYNDRNGFSRNLATNADLGDVHTKGLRGALRLIPTSKSEIVFRGDYLDATGGGPLFQPISLATKSTATSEIIAELGLNPKDPASAQIANQQFLLYGGGINPTLASKLYSNPEHDQYNQGGGSMTATLDLHPILLKSITAYRNYSHVGDEDLDASTFKILSSHIAQELNQFTQELQGSGDALNEKLKYVAGYYYYQTSGMDNSSSTSVPVLNPANPSLQLDTLGDQSNAGYAQLDYSGLSVLNFTVGVRETTESKTLDSHNQTGTTCQVPVVNRIGTACEGRFSKGNNNTSYLFGVNTTRVKDMMLYFTTSRGFKSGGINERGTATNGSFATFSPEIATNYEGGVKSDLLAHRLRLNLDYYYTDYANIQRSASVAGPSNSVISVTTNAAKARINGAELETSVIPFRNALISAVGALTEPKYITFTDLSGNHANQRFEAVSRWTYGLSGQYAVPLRFGQFLFQSNWSWQSDQDLAPAARGFSPSTSHVQGAYGLFDMRATIDLPQYKTDIAVYGKNLLDQRFYTSMLDLTSSLGTSVGQIGAPRIVGVVIRKRF